MELMVCRLIVEMSTNGDKIMKQVMLKEKVSYFNY